MNDEKLQALAQYLSIDANELTTEDDNRYSVNARQVKYGTAPDEYLKNANDLKLLLNKPMFKLLDDAITEINDSGALVGRDAVYNVVAEYLNNKTRYSSAQREAEKRLKVACIYVVNVLFWLLSTDDSNTSGPSYRTAWAGELPFDHRRLSWTDDGQYLVLTDDEADEATEEYTQQYIDDVIMPEIPEAYQMYIDEDAVKRDLDMNGSRGENLSSYDGSEDDIEYNGITYYIYRIN